MNHQLLTDKVIGITLQKFWDEIMSKLSDKTYIMILFRMEYDIDLVFTLGPQSKINKHNFTELFNSYKNLLEIKDDRYKNTPINSTILSYKIIPDDKLILKNSKIFNPSRPNKTRFFTFYGYSLPTTTNFKQWGEVISATDTVVFIRKFNSNLIYLIHITDSKDNNRKKLSLCYEK